MSALGTCARCHEVVRWVQLSSGKSMPVQPAPDPDGTVGVMRNPDGALMGRVISAGVPLRPFEKPYVTHFAVCPGEPS